MNSAKSPAKKSWLQTLIKNKSERKKVIFIFTISFLLVVAGLIYIPIYKHSLPLDSKVYEGNFKELGSIARIGFFAALAILNRPSVWIVDRRSPSVDPTRVESVLTLIRFKTMHKRNLMFGDIEKFDR